MTSPLFIVFFVSSLSSSVSPFVPLLELEGHEVPVRKMRRGRVMMYTVQALDKQDGHDDGDDDEKDSDDDDDLKINQEDSPKLSFSLAKSH